MTRVTPLCRFPLCVAIAIFYIASGVPQTLAGSVDVTTLEEGQADAGIGSG